MKLFIIADDLTGANATSVLLSKSGFKCSSFIDSDLLTDELLDRYDVVAVSTDSRGLTKQEAYQKVEKEVKRVSNKKNIISKRIDSTLRGNIGAEIDAVLDNIDDGVAIVVSSYPDSGRISIGGFLLVDSIPLEKTLVAKDPKCPVKKSRIKEIIQEQTNYKVSEINIQEVFQGEEHLSCRINQLVEEGNKIIVIDALTNSDIDVIAKASNKCNFDIVAVDPGPYTRSLMNAKYEDVPIEQGKKVFFAIGSVSKTTINQIEYLSAIKSVKIIKVNPMNLIKKEEKENEINKALKEIKLNLDSNEINILGIATTTHESEVLNLSDISSKMNISEEEISNLINEGLAEITEKAIELSKSSVGALYTSGGDVTIEVMKKLEVEGIDIKDEVIPLAVYGRFIGGKYDNMPVITKGGLIGDRQTLSKCMDYLLTKISTQYYLK